MAYEITEMNAREISGILMEIPHPPEKLWCAGALPPRENKILAVVGSRALTPYGKEACDVLIQGLAGYPISILSGLALGADAAAHEAALRHGLHTIAIPGSGLSKEALYPRAHLHLSERILAAGGALISEHPPEYRAAKYDFPSRNRIMVGMADAVLIVEAAERSGSLITARMASDYGRDLMCVPHRIGDRNSAGTHQFIRLGATLVSESAHILEMMGIEADVQSRAIDNSALTESELILYAHVAEPRSRDELIEVSALPYGEALASLMSLEFRGLIVEQFGLVTRTALDHI